MIYPYRVLPVIAAALIALATALQAAAPPHGVPPVERIVRPGPGPHTAMRWPTKGGSRRRVLRAVCDGRVPAMGPHGDDRRATPIPTYTCPMHPDVRTSTRGSCPHGGMPLTPIDQARSYRLDVEAIPNPPAAGQPLRLRLTVRDAQTKNIGQDFAVLHEKRLHLFLISQDLAHYDYIHPEQDDDGTWAVDVTVPRPSFYRLYADFRPEDGAPRVLSQPLVTAGVAGDSRSAAARLVPDPVLRKAVGGMLVELELPPEGLIAGRDETLTSRLTDVHTDAAVTDIEPYLGAWEHTLIISEDTRHFVHAQPIEQVTYGASMISTLMSCRWEREHP